MATLFSVATSLVGLAAVGLYVYVGVAVGKNAVKQGNSLRRAAFRAATWPASIWTLVP